MARCHIGCEQVPVERSLPSPSHRRVVFEAKDRLCRAEAGQREFAEWRKFAPAVACELFRGADLAPQRPRQLFEASGKIDGWTDAGEIEPIAAADIAVEDIADVQR